MGMGQLLTMPLFFASNAIYPIYLMPDWLKAIAQVNPFIYMVDGMRGFMVASWASQFGILTDMTILFVASIFMIVITGRLFPRVVR